MFQRIAINYLRQWAEKEERKPLVLRGARHARNSQAEVDFLIRYKPHLLPIEVKTGGNAKLRSLHLFMETSKEKIALRLWNGPMTSDTITRKDGGSFMLYNIPLYYAGHLETILDRIYEQ